MRAPAHRLTLTRKEGERVRVSAGGVEVWVRVNWIATDRVSLDFTAPREVLILREELLDEPCASP